MGIKLKHLGEIPTGLYTPFGGAKYRWEFRDFQQITRNISQTIQDSVIVTIEGEQKTTPKLSNGTSFNDLE